MTTNGEATGERALDMQHAHIAALPDPDAYFSMLSDACRDLDATQGHLFHAQLVLVLVHHIADPAVVREAIEIARRGLDRPAGSTSRAHQAI